jgi:hypothetical protein
MNFAPTSHDISETPRHKTRLSDKEREILFVGQNIQYDTAPGIVHVMFNQNQIRLCRERPYDAG